MNFLVFKSSFYQDPVGVGKGSLELTKCMHGRGTDFCTCMQDSILSFFRSVFNHSRIDLGVVNLITESVPKRSTSLGGTVGEVISESSANIKIECDADCI